MKVMPKMSSKLLKIDPTTERRTIGRQARPQIKISVEESKPSSSDVRIINVRELRTAVKLHCLIEEGSEYVSG